MIAQKWGILTLILTGSTGAMPAGAADAEQAIRKKLNISTDERAELDQGKAIAREVETKDRAEILVFGAIYVNGSPSVFLKTYTEVEKLVDGKGFLAAKKFQNPPVLSDLANLTFDEEDLRALRTCSPGDCEVQLPADQMKKFRQTIDWEAPQAAEQANAARSSNGTERSRDLHEGWQQGAWNVPGQIRADQRGECFQDSVRKINGASGLR